MKKKIMILFAGIFILFPRAAKADIDILSSIQDEMSGFMEVVNKEIKDFTGFQFNLQELSLNRNILTQFHEQTIGAYNAKVAEIKGRLKTELSEMTLEFINTKMDSFSLQGITKNINLGDYVTPALKSAIATQYVKKADMNNDVQNTVALDNRNNNLRVENISVAFANSTVNLRQLANKMAGKTDEGEVDDDNTAQEQLPMLKERYAKLSRDANHRWINVLSSSSRIQGLMSEVKVTQKPVDNLTDVLGEEPQAEEGMGILPAGGGISWDDLKKAYNSAKSGDYAAAFGGVSGVASNFGISEGTINTLSNVAAGATTASNAYKSAKSGNWGDALTTAAGGVGSTLGGKSGNIVSGLAGSAGGTLDSALSGNWGSALTSATGGVGGAVGGKAGNVLTGLSGNAGGTLDSALSGNWGNAIGSAGSGVSGAIGGKAGNIISGATGGVSGAVNAGQDGNVGNVLSALGSGAGNVFTASGKGTTGNILSNVSGNAGNAVNSAKSGDASNVLAGLGAGVSNGLAAGGKNTAANIVSGATSGASAAVSGNSASDVLAGLGTGVSNGLAAGGKNTAANIVSNATSGAVTATGAQSAGGVVSGLGAGLGGALTAGGNTNVGNLATSAGQTASAGLDALGTGGNIIDIGKNAAENDALKNSAQDTYNAYKNVKADRKAKNSTQTAGEGEK